MLITHADRGLPPIEKSFDLNKICRPTIASSYDFAVDAAPIGLESRVAVAT